MTCKYWFYKFLFGLICVFFLFLFLFFFYWAAISAFYALLYHPLCFIICHYVLFCMTLCCIWEINLIRSVNDAVKHYLIQNREPHSSFKFPAKQYKDKRSTTGYPNRHCNREWLKMFSFVSYSEKVDGLFACPAFYSPTRHIGGQIS